MPSFGERLKQEREKRKITLEQISVSTKIGTRMLQALEEDNFSQLPGGIFNKGFVRAYSRFVGLDEDQTVAEYLEASGDAPLVPAEPSALEDEADEIEENVSRERSTAPPRQLPWGWFAALLLVVALALSFWNHQRREHPRSTPPTPTATETQSPAPRLAVGASGQPNPARSPIAVSAKAAAPKAYQASTAALPAASPGEFTLVIQAREDSWISITADDKTVSSELLLAGSQRTVRGRKQIIVKAGNSGGIDFRLNGNKLATGGESGEVRTLTFGPGGILPNAPAPLSTP
ncbi:MAG: helix-turn-helix domain-containing protein [Terriglobales bacterium]